MTPRRQHRLGEGDVHRRGGGQEGAAGVFALAFAVVVLTVGLAAGALGGAVAARHRAESAADLAALAAAGRALMGPVAACRAAADLAARSGAVLRGCRLDDAVADVVVTVAGRSVLAQGGTASARARAGPDGRVAAQPVAGGRG